MAFALIDGRALVVPTLSLLASELKLGKRQLRTSSQTPALSGLSQGSAISIVPSVPGSTLSRDLFKFSLQNFHSSARGSRMSVKAQQVPLTAEPPTTNGVTVVGLTTPARPVIPEISFSASDAAPLDFEGDILFFAIFEDALDKENSFAFSSPELKELDSAVGGILSEVAQEEDFKGKSGQSVLVRLPGKGFKRLGLLGLGSQEGASTPSAWKASGGALATTAKQSKAVSAGLAVVGASDLPAATKVAAISSIASGTVLGAFDDVRFKTEAKPPTLKNVSVYGLATGPEVEDVVGRAVRTAAGVILTRQLVNAPPNVLTPSAMAEVATAIAEAHNDVIKATILDEDECAKLGMGAYLGVSAASENPPKFIHLVYTPPGGPVHTKLAVVGKGLTFDSGGYNLKTGAGSLIELMKFDMGGAGATLGAAKAIGAIQPPGVEVHFIVAACENMVSGKGMRPGDILTASNGRTIEVNNTDAEGRLTLADALVYACKQEVDKIVDLATLTGACIIALGNDIAGMFTPHDSIAEELQTSSTAAGEKLWRMPMEESYKEMLKSNIADTVNTGGRPGGSITAALFLKEFVDAKIPWAHLDIAGPVWAKEKGATGFGVATLVQWITSHAKVAAQ